MKVFFIMLFLEQAILKEKTEKCYSFLDRGGHILCDYLKSQSSKGKIIQNI